MTRFLVNRPHVNRIWDERLRAIVDWEPQFADASPPNKMELPAAEGEEPASWPFVDLGIGD